MIVTLTSDFGQRDPYAAAMKGVVLARCPDATLVDLTHEISAGDILEGSLFLGTAVPHFPVDTIHVAVIDPGVGTARQPIVARVGGHYLIAPDNGLLTHLTRTHPLDEARVIENRNFMGPVVSTTFHGRDIFAPAAAALASGARFEDAGPILKRVQYLRLNEAVKQADDSVTGEIIHVDRFGNLISNIHRSLLDEGKTLTVSVGAFKVGGLATTYADGTREKPIAVIGSTDHLEIAVNRGNAQKMLGLARGDTVRVKE